MKKTILACSCVLLLSTAGGAFAQMQQPAPGASSQGNVGPGAATGSKSKHMKKGTTTGMSSGKMMKSGTSSSSQGNVGPGTGMQQPAGR
jgi:hypothetical protein